MRADAAPLRAATIASDDVRMHITVDGLDDHPVLCLRRLTLDAVLVEAASTAGAQVRHRHPGSTGCCTTGTA